MWLQCVQDPPALPTWGIMVILNRRLCRPILAMFTPSMMISPSEDSLIRNKPRVSDDFPAPVRPTMPTCRTGRSCGDVGMLQTQGSPSRWLGQSRGHLVDLASTTVLTPLHPASPRPTFRGYFDKRLEKMPFASQRLRTFHKSEEMLKGIGCR